jgi:hypothetical protein
VVLLRQILVQIRVGKNVLCFHATEVDFLERRGLHAFVCVNIESGRISYLSQVAQRRTEAHAHLFGEVHALLCQEHLCAGLHTRVGSLRTERCEREEERAVRL